MEDNKKYILKEKNKAIIASVNKGMSFGEKRKLVNKELQRNR